MVINYDTLGEILEREVVEQLDHRNLNLEVEWLRGMVTTSENLVRAIWDILKGKIPHGRLHSLTLSETESSSVTYFGPRSGAT
jgi:6-pyruvoyltetrahydropterin/6-carboxytetrahydropterin synthase